MEKVVILELDGSLETGCRVTLEISSLGIPSLLKRKGNLPPNLPLVEALQQHWLERYRPLGAPYRRSQDAPEIWEEILFRIKPKQIVQQALIEQRIAECQESGQQLCDLFNQWLDSPDFRLLDKTLRQHLSPEDTIRLLVRTQNLQLQKLPWTQWELLQHYPNAEPALSPLESTSHPPQYASSRNGRVKILAILGHDDGLNLAKDRRLIENLPQVDPHFLIKPDRATVIELLQDQSWDILFFAGHSETENDQGRLYLNPDESITLDELWFTLKKAVEQGLQLAIFNSCDGLGLSQRLDDLNIPQMIVMRELVPDQVAQKFLTYFLKSFATGKPLYLAVREARERLHDELEPYFPCASWLPVICQNPVILPPSWESLCELPETPSPDPPPAPGRKRPPWRQLILTSLLVTACIIGLREVGVFQPAELKAFDHLMRLRPDTQGADNRIFVITIGEEDLQYQDEQGWERRDSLSFEALDLLWQKLKPHEPRVLGMGIAKPKNLEDHPELMPEERIILGCQIASQDLPSLGAPDGWSEERLGFTQAPEDPRGFIRRQTLVRRADPNCPTRRSFALRIANIYWQQEGQTILEEIEDIEEYFHPLIETNTGGYRLSKRQAGGVQVLLNYRFQSPARIPLRFILQGLSNAEIHNLVRDRIILIGRDEHSEGAVYTPYKSDIKEAGIVIQAHMISQILDQSRLYTLPQPIETLWILSWSVVSLMVIQLFRKPRLLILGVSSTLGVLFFLCYISFNQNWWIPLIPSTLGVLVTSSVSIYLDQKLHGIKVNQSN
ncbi:CHASE2 domain-containing protein [Spirulina subsalsa FACHB-351]|uniref:CHASE2 domain-containing protein n=1 Tax=Spirulina subsalsa FACHB-351 TaxID=234711 RepID=A0ABT3L2G8_9CYAN|nr:CHASE2 domain-containing protein [Spirulina subsalsa]MCW6035701.1 CHASE2 domain-containing protein [Spirulina subsalsa FACHB-351]